MKSESPKNKIGLTFNQIGNYVETILTCNSTGQFRPFANTFTTPPPPHARTHTHLWTDGVWLSTLTSHCILLDHHLKTQCYKQLLPEYACVVCQEEQAIGRGSNIPWFRRECWCPRVRTTLRWREQRRGQGVFNRFVTSVYVSLNLCYIQLIINHAFKSRARAYEEWITLSSE